MKPLNETIERKSDGYLTHSKQVFWVFLLVKQVLNKNC